MAAGHGSESFGIHGVREKADQFRELVVGHEGIRGSKELEFGGVGREDLAERADLPGGEAFGFEQLICGLDAVFVLAGLKQANPQLVDIIIRGESMAVGIDKSKGGSM